MKPILFNTAMVRAILDGRKTQTRRVVKPQPQSYSFDGRVYIFDEGELPKPQYQPGDILWVRETWKKVCATESYYEGGEIVNSEELFGYMYRADNLIRWDEREPKNDEFHLSDITRELKWRPSIHMPREAARLFLRVTDVRVERLHEMTDDDVRREGIENPGDFIRLWDSTIKAVDRDRYGWYANPWVWVYTFERCGKEGEPWSG